MSTDFTELMAHQAAQQAELMARQEEAMGLQREQFQVLQDKEERLRITTEGQDVVEGAVNTSLFDLQQWQRTFNKREENAHAVDLGLDAPYANTNFPSEIFTHEAEDWSFLDRRDNPFDRDPTDVAEEAAARADAARADAEEA